MTKSNSDDDVDYYETFQPLFFFPYSVTVTKSSVSFGYYFWLFTQMVDRSRIVSATPLEDVKGLREWGGWGIRLRRIDGHWETGYVARNGGAVKIEVKSGDDDDSSSSSSSSSWYVFTCKDPQKVCDLLSNQNRPSSLRN
jgi:hypothetical protein